MATSATATAAPKAQNTAQERLDVYTGVNVGQLSELVDLGIDRHELELSRVRGAQRGAKATVRVETILSGDQAS